MAQDTEIGGLVVKMRADLSDYIKQLDNMANETDNKTKKMSGMLNGIGTAALKASTALGAAAGIEEGEHSGNEQARLVVRNSVRSGKYSGSFTVHALTVGEKQRIESRIMFIHYATLTDEAGGYQRGVADGYAGANNEISAFNT